MVSVEGVGAGAAVWPLRSCDVENVEKRIPYPSQMTPEKGWALPWH